MDKRNSNHLVEPESKDALTRMKNEIANELGIKLPYKNYLGDVSSRDCGRIGGKIGGKMVHNLIQIAEEKIK
jgi:small acid-soluble spore protein D (minor alpha/beta-type SASP)